MKSVKTMRNLVVGLMMVGAIGCGDDATKKSGSNNGANNGVINNGANNGVINNGANNGATNNGATNNGTVINNGANNGVTGFDPGVDTSKSLADLTATETETACEAMATYYNDSGLFDALCKVEGFSTAASLDTTDTEMLRTACNEEYDLCMAETLEQAGGALCEPTDCTATVAEGVACIVAQASGFVTAFAAVPSCDEMTAEDIGILDTLEPGPEPTECSVVQATCPG